MRTANNRDLPIKESFNRREIDILRLIKEGRSNKEIAQELYLTLETVKWYNQQIYGKLGVNSRTQAILKATDAGLISSTPDSPAFEPVRAPSNRPKHNLPAALSTFIGRRKERADLRAMLHGSSARLVTIRGPGGMGKTRLALLAAEEARPAFEHGAWWVDLAPLSDPGQLTQCVARALGIETHEQIPYEEILLHFLAERALLLVLDNCEHLVDACARLVTTLLSGCPNLRVLATSREALGVAGEVQYPLTPLAFPDPQRLPPPEKLVQSDAVQMLVERIRLVSPGFELNQHNALAVTQICQRLDGIPLALELVAARANLLSVEQIAVRLEASYSLLASGSRGSDPRHQTMQMVLDWSYRLLTKPEQALLQRLAVFASGFTLAAAESVCAFGEVLKAIEVLDLLNNLVNKSMVVVDDQQPQETRCRLLEPIRQYLLDRLAETADLPLLKEHHLDYYLSLAIQAGPYIRSREAAVWLEQLNRDLYNLRLALRWSLDRTDSATVGASPNRLEKGLQLATALHWFWLSRNHCAEGVEWLRNLLQTQRERETSQAVTLAGKVARGRALYVLADLIFEADTWWTNITPTPEAERLGLLAESEGIFQELGDDYRLDKAIARLYRFGSQEKLIESHEIFQAVKDRLFLALCESIIGIFFPEHELARSYLENSLAHFKEIGDMEGQGMTYFFIACLSEALPFKLYNEGLLCFESVGDRWRAARYSSVVATEAIDRGNYPEAERQIERIRSAAEDFGDRTLRLHYYRNQAHLAWARGKNDQAVSYSLQGMQLASQMPYIAGLHWFPLYTLCRVALSQEDSEQAGRYLKDLLQLLNHVSNDNPWHRYFCHNTIHALSLLAIQTGRLEQAAVLLGAGKTCGRNSKSIHLVSDYRIRVEYDQTLQTAQSALGKEAFSAALQAGRDMPVNQVMALALDFLESI